MFFRLTADVEFMLFIHVFRNISVVLGTKCQNMTSHLGFASMAMDRVLFGWMLFLFWQRKHMQILIQMSHSLDFIDAHMKWDQLFLFRFESFRFFFNFGFLFIWRDCIFGEQKAELFWFFLFFIFWLFCYYWMKSVWKVCLLGFHHLIIAFNCRSVLVTPMTKTCQVSSWLVCYFLLSEFWDVTRFKTLTDIPSKNHTNAQRQLNMSITKCTLW